MFTELRHKLGIFLLLLGSLLATPLIASTSQVETTRVVTTVGQLGDVVKEIGGNRVNVESLMGPGVDPHLYKASASDITKLKRADIIFYVGLKLEGKMDDIFKKMRRKNKAVYAITEALPEKNLLKPAAFDGNFDPHIWFDVPLWTEAIDTIVQGLSSFDATAANFYERRAREFKSRMRDLHKWVKKELNSIPKKQRVLITSHDAFNYFGRAYGFQVVGLQGISTVTEAGLADVAKMVDFIKQKKVKAIFVESSVSKKAIERVSRDAGVVIGGELFSDSMGVPGDIEKTYDKGTYEGMVRHNVTTIVNSLK